MIDKLTRAALSAEALAEVHGFSGGGNGCKHGLTARNFLSTPAEVAPFRLRAKEAIQDAQARRANGEKLNFHVEPTATGTETDPLCPAA